MVWQKIISKGTSLNISWKQKATCKRIEKYKKKYKYKGKGGSLPTTREISTDNYRHPYNHNWCKWNPKQDILGFDRPVYRPAEKRE